MKLSESADVAQPPIAGCPLPFTQEADARIVNTCVRVGDPPLRYFKNDYDKPPVSYIPKRPSCTISPSKCLQLPSDEAMQTMERTGLKGPDLPEASLRSYQNAEPWVKKTLSMENDDPSEDYFASLQYLSTDKHDAPPKSPKS